MAPPLDLTLSLPRHHLQHTQPRPQSSPRDHRALSQITPPALVLPRLRLHAESSHDHTPTTSMTVPCPSAPPSACPSFLGTPPLRDLHPPVAARPAVPPSRPLYPLPSSWLALLASALGYLHRLQPRPQASPPPRFLPPPPSVRRLPGSTSTFPPSGPRPFRPPSSVRALAPSFTCAPRLFSGRASDVRMQDAHALRVEGQEGRGAEQLLLVFLFVLTRVLPAPTTLGTAPRPRAPPDPNPGVDNAGRAWQGPRGAPRVSYAAHTLEPEPRERDGAQE